MMLMRRSTPIFVAGLAAFAASATFAESSEDEVRLSVDRYASLETGADLTSAAVALMSFGESAAFAPLDRHPGPGIPARLLRTVFFDAPVAWWFGIVQHEVFGHGGRVREFGSTASVHLGSPWGGGRASTSFDAAGFTPEQLLLTRVAGSEANGWAATRMEREAVGGRPFGGLDLLFLVSNRYVTTRYVLRTTPDPVHDPGRFYQELASGGDVANYLVDLARRFTTEGTIVTPSSVDPVVASEWRRLRRQAWWNAADPGAWLALACAFRHVIRGDAPSPVLVPQIGGRRFLPVLSADWYPDGGVISLEVIVGRAEEARSASSQGWVSIVARRGAGRAGSFGAVGAATDRLWETRLLRIGGEAEVWNRPGAPPRGGMRISLSARKGRLKAFYIDVGAKGAGHWPGRPAAPGVFFSLGLVVPLTTPSARADAGTRSDSARAPMPPMPPPMPP